MLECHRRRLPFGFAVRCWKTGEESFVAAGMEDRHCERKNDAGTGEERRLVTIPSPPLRKFPIFVRRSKPPSTGEGSCWPDVLTPPAGPPSSPPERKGGMTSVAQLRCGDRTCPSVIPVVVGATVGRRVSKIGNFHFGLVDFGSN
nr:hypothetical protein Iba_chr02eCG7700 [Ipomoea batatas]